MKLYDEDVCQTQENNHIITKLTNICIALLVVSDFNACVVKYLYNEMFLSHTRLLGAKAESHEPLRVKYYLKEC